MKIKLDALALDEMIGEGGFGEIWSLANSPIRGIDRELVYKRPKDENSPNEVEQTLGGMEWAVFFRDGLSLDDQQRLDHITAWPIAMVVSGQSTVGCLMPLVPALYFKEFRGFAGQPPKRQIVDLGKLSWDDRSLDNIGLDKAIFGDDVARLLILTRLAESIAFLHAFGVVYGDLNLKNVAVSFDPPTSLLMDCDATADASDPYRHRRQGHFPYWAPPEYDDVIGGDPTKNQTFASDVYKVALAFVKFMTAGPGATQRRAIPAEPPAAYSSHLLSTLKAALSSEPAARPSARELADAALSSVAIFTAPPVAKSMMVSPRRVVRGEDVTVSWQLESRAPLDITIQGPGGIEVEVPESRGSISVPVHQSGPLSLSAVSPYSSATFDLGQVSCFELPPFALGNRYLPRLTSPALPRVPSPVVGRAFTELAAPSVMLPDANAVPRALHEIADSAPRYIPLRGLEVERLRFAGRSTRRVGSDRLILLLRRQIEQLLHKTKRSKKSG